MTPIQRRQYEAHASLSTHRRKVDASRACLADAADRGRLVVASSWGKDSTVLCHLALEVLGEVDILHLASPARLPGGEHVEEYFARRATVHTVGGARTLAEYMDWLHEVGLPHERTASQQAAVVKGLKKDIGSSWCLEQGFLVQALGVRAEESRTRRRHFRIHGLTYVLKSGLVITNPLAWWSSSDVWAYLVSRDLPWHELYDCETHGLTRETIRNAGWCSTDCAATGRIAWLRRHYPEQYETLAEEWPAVRMLT